MNTEELSDAVERDLRPRGIVQRELADHITQTLWRLRRIPSQEMGIEQSARYELKELSRLMDQRNELLRQQENTTNEPNLPADADNSLADKEKQVEAIVFPASDERFDPAIIPGESAGYTKQPPPCPCTQGEGGGEGSSI